MGRKALVIGNSDYIYTPSLKNPINDIKAIKRILELKNFHVDYKENLKKYDFLHSISQFKNKLTDSDDLALFYYAGHSIQIMDRNYLLPIDIPRDLSRLKTAEEEAIYLLDVVDAIKETSGPKIILLDACRSNIFQDNVFADNDIFNKGLSEIESSHNMLICYSTQPGNTCSDGKKGSNYGCFTEEFIEHLSRYGLTLTEVISKTREGVLKKTNFKQIPWDSNSLSSQLSLDQIEFPGEMFYEFPLKSDGIDTVCCSKYRFFIGTEKNLLFVFNDVFHITPDCDLEGNNKYMHGWPKMLTLTLPNDDYINEAVFYNEDIMLGVSQNGYLYKFNLQKMLTAQIRMSGSFPIVSYSPDVMFKSTYHDNSFYSICIKSDNLGVFISDSNGYIYEIDISCEKHLNNFELKGNYKLSSSPITSVCINNNTSELYFTDGVSVCKFDHNAHSKIDLQKRIQSEHLKYHPKIGVIICSNDNNISFITDDDRIETKFLGIQRHPLKIFLSADDNEQKYIKYKTSIDILEGRYIVIGTNEPSVIIYDNELNQVVKELFLDLHLISEYQSSINGLAIFDDSYLLCRSRLHYFGMWKIKRK